MAAARGSPVTDLADFISQMGPAFVRQRETTTPQIDPSALALSDEAFALAIRQAGSTQDALIQNILKRAALSFSSELPASHSAGVYNDTVTMQLANEAMARATGEAADAVLKAQTSGITAAGNIAGQRVASQKGTSTVKSPGLGSRAGTIATSAILGQLARKGITKVSDLFSASPAEGSMPEQLGGPGFTGATASEEAIPVVDSSAMTDVAFGATADVGTTATASSLGAPAEGADSLAGVQAGDEALVGTAPASAASSEAATAEALGITVGTTEVGTTAGAAEGATAAEAGGTAAAGGEAAAAGEGAAAASTASEGEVIGEAAAAAWIVCTELHKQGRMPTRYYLPGAKVFLNYPEYGKEAYYLWAKPLTKHLQKYPHSLLSKTTCYIMNKRAMYLAGKRSIVGFISVHLLYFLCWVISRSMNLGRKLYAT